MADHLQGIWTDESPRHRSVEIDACQSISTLSRIERHVEEYEKAFGRERLLRLVSQIPLSDINEHVNDYRQVIRRRKWPNENRPTSFALFLKEYEWATLAYLRVGFLALEFLEKPTAAKLIPIYRMVEASEALRGQFGKRSPTGLDARIDAYTAELDIILDAHDLDDDGRIGNLLCTPGDPFLSAESALLHDLNEAKASFPSPPSIGDLITVDAAQAKPMWIVLRRHAKWSLPRLVSWYTEFDISMLMDAMYAGQNQRQALASERAAAVECIRKTCSPSVHRRIEELAAATAVLNHLNLALEPCFSFKAGAGLVHGLIFKMAASEGLIEGNTDTINTQKWALFSHLGPSEPLKDSA